MSHIGQNIKKIRKIRKLSQADFASMFQLARPSVGAWEEGRSEPKTDTIIAIAKRFGLSIDALLTREMTVNELFHLDQFKRKMDAAHSKKDITTTVSLALIPASTQIEYILNFKKADFINRQTHITIPLNKQGDFRLFEVETNEMQIHREGIKPGDWVLCKKVTKPAPSTVVILVTSEGIITKRLKTLANNSLIVHSDNPHYQEKEIPSDNILEIWQAEGLFTSQLLPPDRLEDKMLDLEKKNHPAFSKTG